MTIEDLTQLQKIALEGEVAKALSSARHTPEVLYRIYTIMRTVSDDIAPYMISVIRDLVEVREKDLNKVLLEVSLNEPPLWLWIERTVADIKLSLTLASADGMICEAELDKKLLQKKIVKSACVFFVRTIALTSTRAARELCQYIIDEEAIVLDFLADACFSLLGEISELPPVDKVTDTIFHSAFDIRNTLSYKFETDVLEKRKERDQEIDRKSVV